MARDPHPTEEPLLALVVVAIVEAEKVLIRGNRHPFATTITSHARQLRADEHEERPSQS